LVHAAKERRFRGLVQPRKQKGRPEAAAWRPDPSGCLP
jgi:hypothetical protein